MIIRDVKMKIYASTLALKYEWLKTHRTHLRSRNTFCRFPGDFSSNAFCADAAETSKGCRSCERADPDRQIAKRRHVVGNFTVTCLQRPALQGPLSVVDDNQKLVGALSVVGATKMTRCWQKFTEKNVCQNVSQRNCNEVNMFEDLSQICVGQLVQKSVLTQN